MREKQDAAPHSQKGRVNNRAGIIRRSIVLLVFGLFLFVFILVDVVIVIEIFVVEVLVIEVFVVELFIVELVLAVFLFFFLGLFLFFLGHADIDNRAP